MDLSDKELEAVVRLHAEAISSETYEGQRTRYLNEDGTTDPAGVDWKKIADAADRISQIAMAKVQASE